MSKDFSKYSFKDHTYNKRRLVEAVVKDYLTSHKNITFSELQEVFPPEIQQQTKVNCSSIAVIKVDPTWTDNLGYVVYGYVNNNGQEIQCKPNKDYCVTYPASLNNLPLPPAMGPRQAPSKSANSTNREETIKDAAPGFIGELFEKIFEDVDYKEMDTYVALLISADLPFSVIKNKEIDFDKIGFALEVPFLWDVTAAMIGLEYLQNLEEENNIHALLLDFAFVRRLYNNLAWFLGGGFGLRLDFDQSSNYWAQEDWSTGYLALKANTGFIINLSHLFTKIDVSYNNVTGFSVGAGIGLGAIAY